MNKLLAERKTDLLQFVSQRTRRPFSAFLVVQKDGKVGFEFEARDPSKARGARARPASTLRVLGAHPKDRGPVELHSGRYGPYVKHGTVNATLPDSDKADSLTLDEALLLLAAKSGKAGSGSKARAPRKTAAKSPRAVAAKVAAKTAVKTAAKTAVKSATASAAKSAAKTAAKTAAKSSATAAAKVPAKSAAKVAAKVPAKSAAKKPPARKPAARRRSS
jgi:Topoisomerase C-terminal repeat